MKFHEFTLFIKTKKTEKKCLKSLEYEFSKIIGVKPHYWNAIGYCIICVICAYMCTEWYKETQSRRDEIFQLE